MSTRPRLGHRVVAAAAVIALAVGLGFWWLSGQMYDERRETGKLAASRAQLDAVANAQGHLGAEISALLALGAFRTVPPAFRALAGGAVGGGDRDVLVANVVAADAEGPARLAELERAGLEVPQAVVQALRQLDDETLDALRYNRDQLDAVAYVKAWDWARRESGLARDRGEVAGQRLAELARRDEPWRDTTVIAVAAAVLVAIAAAALVLRWSLTSAFRRSEEQQQELALRNEHLTSLFTVVRSLGTSLDTDQVAATVAERAVDGTDADFAVVALLEGDALDPVARAGPIEPAPAPASRGLVAGVIDSAQPTRAVVDSEPLVASAAGPLSLAAAPLVAGGRVRGVVLIGVARTALLPEEDELALEFLAMCAAPALQATERYGSTSELALIDELTGLHNKRRLDTDLAVTVEDCARDQRPVAVAMIDIDHFKQYNDTHGHPAGDRVLRRVAGIVRSCVREQDRVYRYGGEELAVLLPATHLGDALTVAERIRAGVALDGEPDGGPAVTVSVGVASLVGPDPATLVASADAALYRAKNSGRNRVEASDRSDPVSV